MKPSRVGFVVVVLLSVVQFVSAEEPTVRMQDIERVIRESEYHVTWQDQTVLPDLEAAWQAPNRVFGAAENRLETSRGELTESFVNDEGGLWHILTIDNPLSGGGPVSIELEWSAAGMSLSPRAVEFQAQTGRRLVYSLDEAFDAAGASVEVALSSGGGRLLLTYSAPIVAYPVTIKNLLTGTANATIEGNQIDALMGSQVATAGDVNGDGFADVIVSAPFFDGGEVDEGFVLVFHGAPTGIAGASASTTLQSNQAHGVVGTSVASAGDVNGDGYNDVIIGGPGYRNGQASEGLAFVFHGSVTGIENNGPSLALHLAADSVIESNQAFARLGWSVSEAGDVNADGYTDVIIGARDYSLGQNSEGAAFVFHGSPTGVVSNGSKAVHLAAQSVLQANQSDAYLGQVVASAGDVNGDGYSDVIMLAGGYSLGQTGEGAAFIFHGAATGILSNDLTALHDTSDTTLQSNVANLTAWGDQVASAGDVNGDGFSDVVLGLSPYQIGETEEGVVFIFHGSPSGISGNGSSTSLEDHAATTLQANQAQSEFGASAASAGDINGDGYGDLIVGAYDYDHGENNEGVAFMFFGRAGGIPSNGGLLIHETADGLLEVNQGDAGFGGAVASAGDLNGDGFSDVIVGAEGFDAGESNEGGVFIYHGAADMLADEPADGQYDAQQLGSSLGWTCASAGDVNGDGRADLVAGAPWYDIGGQFVGRVHVFHGSSGPFLSSPDWTAKGSSASDRIGWWQASAGDVNGDGFGDLVVGVPNHSNGQSNEGRVDVYHGSSSGLPSEPDWSFESDLVDAGFGGQVASAGDVNGDGYGDLIVGARGYTNGESSEGRAYVFFGSPHGLSETPGWTFESDFVNAGLGGAVAGAGDVNGDGFADIIVGAPGYANGHYEEGAAYGFQGSATGLPEVPNWFIETNRQWTGYGFSVAAIGDVNGDGYGDVIVGAPRDSNPESSEGRAYIYHGSSSGLSTIADRVLERNQASSAFGWAVAGARTSGTLSRLTRRGWSTAGVVHCGSRRARPGRALGCQSR